MAKVKGISGLQVWIEVAGKPVREINVPDDSKDARQPPVLKCQTQSRGNNPTCPREIKSGYIAQYIEVESGTRPSVQFAKAADFPYEADHIAYSVQFDDTTLKIRHQPPNLINDSWEDNTDGVVVSTKEEQKSQLFRFADLTCGKCSLRL